MNAEFIARSQEAWDAVEKDRWIYNLENDDGIAPNFNKNRKRKSIPKLNTSSVEPQINASSNLNDVNKDSHFTDDGFGPDVSNTAATENDIPNLLDIPESQLEQ